MISSIIFRNLADDHFSYAEFYARRIRRIFPALILVLLACLICGWFEVPTEYKQLGKHVAAGAGFVSNLALWKDSGYFDAAADQKPLLHLWSLGIEEQFYIIWPLLLGLVWKRKYEYFLSITLVILCGSFFINVYTVQSHPIAAFYSPLSRFWELMIGGVLAYVTLHRPHLLPKNTNWLPVAGLVMILLSVVVLNKFSAFPGWWALLPTVGAFLVISAGHTSWTNPQSPRQPCARVDQADQLSALPLALARALPVQAGVRPGVSLTHATCPRENLCRWRSALS